MVFPVVALVWCVATGFSIRAIKVSQITFVQLGKPIPVYNLSVAHNEDYFVSESGLLVHNCQIEIVASRPGTRPSPQIQALRAHLIGADDMARASGGQMAYIRDPRGIIYAAVDSEGHTIATLTVSIEGRAQLGDLARFVKEGEMVAHFKGFVARPNAPRGVGLMLVDRATKATLADYGPIGVLFSAEPNVAAYYDRLVGLKAVGGGVLGDIHKPVTYYTGDLQEVFTNPRNRVLVERVKRGFQVKK